MSTTTAPNSGPTEALHPSSSNNTKRLSTIKPSGNTSSSTSPIRSNKGLGLGVPGGGKEVVTPGELCGFVDSLLGQLETRFDEMSEQVLNRMNEMSTRIDNLESSIQDLLNSDIDSARGGGAVSPSPAGAPAAGGGKR